MHNNFIDTFNLLHKEYLLKIEDLFFEQKELWIASFIENIKTICAEIVKIQKKLSYPPIAHVEYTLLRTNFIQNSKYIAEVFVYDNDLYLGNKQHCVGTFDVSFLFKYFGELWDDLLKERKRYVDKVKSIEIAELMAKQPFFDFISLLTALVRVAISSAIDEDLFADIHKEEVFRICVGEYMNHSVFEPVYIERKNKDNEEIIKWLLRKDENYEFEDFSKLDFSDCNFADLDLSFSQFQYSTLINCSLNNSMLVNSNFYKANLSDCRLSNCHIHQANFSYANLSNAIFTKVDGDLVRIGNTPLNFRYADLTGVDFTWTNLTGADFTGAILKDALFLGSTLSDANFTGAQFHETFFELTNLDGAIVDDDFKNSGAVLDIESSKSLILGKKFR